MAGAKTKATVDWRDRLHDPFQLKVILTVGILLIGVGVYQLLGSRISELDRKIAKENKYAALHSEVAALRSQMAGVKARLPQDSDVNEWGQYVLARLRVLPLKVRSMEPGKTITFGPYKAVVLQMELEGPLESLNEFVHWLESDTRLFSVSKISIIPSRLEPGSQILQLSVTGIMG